MEENIVKRHQVPMSFSFSPKSLPTAWFISGKSILEVSQLALMVRLKRDTKTYNLFCNISATRLLSPNKRGVISPNFKFVLQQSECCKLRSYAILRGIHVTWCKISLPWTGKTRDMYNIFFGKRRISLYLLQQPFASRNDLICCKTGLICG